MTDTFLLGPCVLYIRAGDHSAEALRSPEFRAGVTEGGVRLKYGMERHEVTDEEGETVCELFSGERLEVSGRFAEFGEGACLRLAGIGEGGRRERRVSVLISAPLPDGDEVSMLIKCAPSAEGDFEFGRERAGGMSFCLRSVGETGTVRFQRG